MSLSAAFSSSTTTFWSALQLSIKLVNMPIDYSKWDDLDNDSEPERVAVVSPTRPKPQGSNEAVRCIGFNGFVSPFSHQHARLYPGCHPPV